MYFLDLYVLYIMHNDDDELPDGVTEIDTQNTIVDDSNTFSIALYSRIQRHVSDTSQETSYTDLNRTAMSNANTDNDAEALSPSFVTRMQEKIKAGCTAEHTSSSNENVERSSSTSLFLDLAEEKLHHHYDRILSNDPLFENTLPTYPSSPTKIAQKIESKTLHTIPYAMIKKGLECLVQDTISSYETYFEKEEDILHTAKQLDTLKTWVNHTRDVFKETSIELPKDAQQQCVSNVQQIINSTNWNHRMHTAQQAWMPLCVNRHMLDELHQIIGGASGCRICFNQCVHIVLVPCGHALCGECADRVEKCPFCHASFYKKQHIYFQ